AREGAGAGEAGGERAHEPPPARQHLGLVAEAREGSHGVGGVTGRHILERSGLHFGVAASSSPSTTEGPSGVRVTRAWKGASASSTALAIAAGGGGGPPSPPPPSPPGGPRGRGAAGAPPPGGRRHVGGAPD